MSNRFKSGEVGGWKMTFPRVRDMFSSYHALAEGVVQDAQKKIVNGLAFGDHVLRHHVKPCVCVDFAPGRHDVKRTQLPVTHDDNATDHHARVVLRLLVEHVLGRAALPWWRSLSTALCRSTRAGSVAPAFGSTS